MQWDAWKVYTFITFKLMIGSETLLNKDDTFLERKSSFRDIVSRPFWV